MGYITLAEHSATVSTTEYFLVSNSTTETSQTNATKVVAVVDLSNMAAGDSYRLRAYTKVASGGTQGVLLEATFSGKQSQFYTSPELTMGGDGWEFSLLKLAGTDRSLTWSICEANADNATPTVTTGSITPGAITDAAYGTDSYGRDAFAVLSGAILNGLVGAGTANTITLAAVPGSPSDTTTAGQLVGMVIVTCPGVLEAGISTTQQRTIVDYNASTKVATVDRDWSAGHTPGSGDLYWVYPGGGTLQVVQGGVAQAGAAGTITLSTSASATANLYRGYRCDIIKGTGAGQSGLIVSYTTGRVATMAQNWTVNPDSTSVYILWRMSMDANVAQWLESTPNVLNSGDVQVDVERWTNQAVVATAVTGVPKVDVADWIGSAPSALSSGKVQVDVELWKTGTVVTPAVTGVPNVNVADWNGAAVAIPAVSGVPKVDVTDWLGTAPNALSGGNVQADVEQWKAGTVPATSVTGVPKVDVADWLGSTVNALTSGNVPAVVNAMAAGVLTASATATNFFDAIFNYTVEGSYSLVQYLRGFASALIAKASGFDTTTRVFRDTGDTKDRITATVGSTGRTAVTLNLT